MEEEEEEEEETTFSTRGNRKVMAFEVSQTVPHL
jgi:hypothetical protein